MTVLLERDGRRRTHAEMWARSPVATPAQHPVQPRPSAQAARDANGRWGRRPASDEAFAVVQATKLLDRLEVSNDVRHETRKFIVAVSGRDATVPSVTPGENSGDVTLYWRTGPMCPSRWRSHPLAPTISGHAMRPGRFSASNRTSTRWSGPPRESSDAWGYERATTTPAGVSKYLGDE